MKYMNKSPVHFRKPGRNPEGVSSYACATIRFVHGPSAMDTQSWHVGMEGDIDDPEIQAKLRKELADGVYNSIINDEWGPPKKSYAQHEEEMAEMRKNMELRGIL